MIVDVHHVGIAVRDLDAACAFFGGALGLPLVKRGAIDVLDAQGAAFAVGGARVELMAPGRPASPLSQRIDVRGEGLHHLALATSDLFEERASLRVRGALVDDQEPREGFMGRLVSLPAAAFDGVLVEVVERAHAEVGAEDRAAAKAGAVVRIDHVVLRVGDVRGVCERFARYFEVPTKRTFERGSHVFSFLRPGDVILEIVGPQVPAAGADARGTLAGLAFEVAGIDALTTALKAKGLPVGEPHPALQGGRIVSIHPSATWGVPIAFIDFEGARRK